MKQVNPQFELACGEYDSCKSKARINGNPHTVTIRIVERRLGVKRGQLRNYRANYLSRKHR